MDKKIVVEDDAPRAVDDIIKTIFNRNNYDKLNALILEATATLNDSTDMAVDLDKFEFRVGDLVGFKVINGYTSDPYSRARVDNNDKIIFGVVEKMDTIPERNIHNFINFLEIKKCVARKCFKRPNGMHSNHAIFGIYDINDDTSIYYGKSTFTYRTVTGRIQACVKIDLSELTSGGGGKAPRPEASKKIQTPIQPEIQKNQKAPTVNNVIFLKHK